MDEISGALGGDGGPLRDRTFGTHALQKVVTGTVFIRWSSRWRASWREHTEHVLAGLLPVAARELRGEA